MTKQITKKKAIEIAAQHNCVAISIAERYTNSELKEVLKQLGFKVAFKEERQNPGAEKV